MQDKIKAYLGIDVSKQWFDLSFFTVQNAIKKEMITQRFDNTLSGLKQMGKLLKQHQVTMNENSLLVIENTGVYHRLIWAYCSQKNLPIHIGNAAQIKWSLGIVRDKDDKADSKRLCIYCYKHWEDLKPTQALDPKLLQLKDMLTARTHLIKQQNSTKQYINELKSSNSKEVHQIMEKSLQAAIEGLKQSLTEVENQINKLLKENEAIQNNYKLLQSVPGIGPVTAVYLICCTNNFSMEFSGKTLASYAGVAPFGHSSGSSIKWRNKVHKMANKDLKKLLHLGARSIVTNRDEFRQYYQRKAQEGKADLSIINAVRNKILLRAAAVIKKQQRYVENYKKAA